jgi:holo-[acyl-carrier protein] synthase
MDIKVGTDIVAVSRVSEAIDRFGDKFLSRFLLEEEIDSLNRVESIAGYWASKEAISKALGCGIGKELSFLDIQITKDNKNAPSFTLRGRAKEQFKIKSSSLSISHDRGFAIAVAVILI